MQTKPSLREQQKRDRRQRIYENALGLFRDHGFQETTIVEIAEAANVSRGTFFNYYPYKEAILIEYFANHFDKLEHIVKHHAERNIASFDTLYCMFDELANFVETNRDLILPLSYELLNPDPERSSAAFNALPLASLIKDVLTRGRALGTVRTDFSRERMSRNIANTYFLTALQWAAYRSERDIRQELKKALQLALEGIEK